MLTSAKISQSELPLASVLTPQQGQALPQGAKFSELFSSMYSADGSAQEMTVATDTTGLLTDTAGNIVSGLMGEVDLATTLEGKQVALMDVATQYLNDADTSLNIDNLPGLVDLDMEQKTQGPAVLGLMEQALSYQPVADDVNRVEAEHSFKYSTEQHSGLVAGISQNHNVNDIQTIESYSAELAAEDSPGLATQDVRVEKSVMTVDSEEVLMDDYVVENASGYNIQPLSETSTGITPTTDFGSDEMSQHIPSLGGEQLTKGQVDNSPKVNVEDELNIEESEIIAPAMMQANNQVSASNIATNAATTSSTTSSVTTAINGSTTNQGMTQWASANNEMSQGANAGFGQGSQSSSQGGTNQQNFVAQQQMMQFQEQRSQAIEQQMAVKTSEELIKTDSKQSLLGTELPLGDRRAQLPLGLQSIQQPVKHPQWGQALGQRVVFMATNQLQQAQITLNPEKLGPVSVKLHMDKDQQVHVTMTAQHATTREAMESALPRLKEMLEQAGVDLGSVDVGDNQQFAENESQDSEASSAQADNSELNVSSDETSAPVTVASTDNIVDYYA